MPSGKTVRRVAAAKSASKGPTLTPQEKKEVPNPTFNLSVACRVILNLSLPWLLLAQNAEDVQRLRPRRPSSVCRIEAVPRNDPTIHH